MTEKQLFTYTNLILTCELMDNYLEDLKETPVYKQALKNDCKLLQKRLDEILKVQLPKLYQIEESFVVSFMNDLKGLVENVSSLSGDDVIAVSQIVKSYKEDKEQFLDKFQLTLRNIDVE